MNSIPSSVDTPTPTPTPSGPAAFARLIRELEDLDYNLSDPDDPTNRAYTATDSLVTVTLDPNADPPLATVVRLDTGGDPLWELTWTGRTPVPTQLIALYAAINDDPVAALEGAATAINPDLPTAGTRPATTGG